MTAAAVLILLNGAVVGSVPPARLLFGHVMAPLTAAVTRWTDRTAIEGNTMTIERGGRRCILHVGVDALACDGTVVPLGVAPFGRAGIAFVPLGEVARALGGDVSYDARSRSLSIAFPPASALETPAPFDPAAVQVTSAPLAAPAAVPLPPRPVVIGSPLPRRTAIPDVPSRGATP
jgi:hypothetical protein